MTTPRPLNILISGSGIAGPCLAYWLHRLIPSCSITILERSPVPRHGGQAVDLRSASVPIVDKMNLLEKVRAKSTTEAGVQFVYANGKTKATFPASGNVEQQSGTSEFEILRGDLAKIFMDATQDLPRIKYVFDEMITAIGQSDGKAAHVTFANGLPSGEYDLVVGADGMMSRTRKLVFGTGHAEKDYVHPLGQYAVLFTMPRQEQDTKFAQWYNADRGRLLLLRPDSDGNTRVYAAVSDKNLNRFSELAAAIKKGNRKEQEAWFEKEFDGAGFESERCMQQMKKADDFYIQQIAQVKMNTWSKGRIALVGDAAYCPSPVSGVGTASAVIGSYVLAGELSRSQDDIPHALTQYELRLRPYISKAQKLPPGVPQIANPQTKWGIWIFNKATGVASSSLVKGLGGLAGKLMPAFGGTKYPFPEYERFGS